MNIVIAVLVVVNCIVLATGFLTLVRLATSNRKTSRRERFYNAWEEHVRAGFEDCQPEADRLAQDLGMSKAPPLDLGDFDEFMGIVPQNDLPAKADGSKPLPWERVVAVLDDAGKIAGNEDPIHEAIVYLQRAASERDGLR